MLDRSIMPVSPVILLNTLPSDAELATPGLSTAVPLYAIFIWWSIVILLYPVQPKKQALAILVILDGISNIESSISPVVAKLTVPKEVQFLNLNWDRKFTNVNFLSQGL